VVKGFRWFSHFPRLWLLAKNLHQRGKMCFFVFVDGSVDVFN
jgi:hypothetical protein